jgi:hypothetical protein
MAGTWPPPLSLGEQRYLRPYKMRTLIHKTERMELHPCSWIEGR